MTEIRTRWITSMYDPRKSVIANRKLSAEDGDIHHYVYAAMLDGCTSRTQINRYTRISEYRIAQCLIDLLEAGYLERQRVGNFATQFIATV